MCNNFRQLEAMNLTINDLKQKIDIMGSALETNARMYNSSENGRKNAESRLKLFEARIKEMESAAVSILLVLFILLKDLRVLCKLLSQ